MFETIFYLIEGNTEMMTIQNYDFFGNKLTDKGTRTWSILVQECCLPGAAFGAIAINSVLFSTSFPPFEKKKYLLSCLNTRYDTGQITSQNSG